MKLLSTTDHKYLRRLAREATILLKNGIQTSVHYKPLSKFQVCKKKAKKYDSLKNSENLYDEIISLPFYTHISKNQLDIVIKTIKKIYQQRVN